MTVQPTHSGRGSGLVAVIAAALLMASGMVMAQSNAPQGPADVSTLPRLDVVSVKPDTSGGALPVREQLGLRLVPARMPVEVLVVEHLERPTPD